MMRRFDAGAFGLSETTYLPDTKLPRHSHESDYLGFILTGSYRETYGSKTRSCQPSMVICHPAGELHAQHFNRTTVRLFRIEVDRTRLNGGFDLRLGCCDFRGGVPVGLAAKLYREFYDPDGISHLAIEGLGL